MRYLLSLGFGLMILALPAFTPAQDEQSATGKIVLSSHMFKMQTGEMYEAIVQGKGFQPSLQTNYTDVTTIYTPHAFDPSRQFAHTVFLVAKKTGEPLGSQIAVYIVERLFDFGSMALIFSLALLWIRQPAVAATPGHVGFLGHFFAPLSQRYPILSVVFARYGALLATVAGALFDKGSSGRGT